MAAESEKREDRSARQGTGNAHPRPNPRVLVPLVLLLVAGGWWYVSSQPLPSSAGIVASGTIEADEVSIASEVPGRVVALPVAEGDRVKAGDLLVKLDDSVQQLQLRMASQPERLLLELQLDKLSVRSPLDGTVTRRSIHPGEVASPGATMMVVARLDEVDLTIYVPEREIGRVRPGQGVEVRVDSFPGEMFRGEVSSIATRAEFTPRNVQTQKDRLNLVFAVKVRIPNPDLRLKPGMPADAMIAAER